MPEQEFEIYLSLLGRLLRLSPAQKAAISDELRDHLEQRLAELMQSGLSRDVALQTAMDEFGDVTGLALDLTRVTRTPLRKVVMRSTIVASTVAALIVGWVTLFVPEHRVAAPSTVQAQSKEEATTTELPNASMPPVDSQQLTMNDEELFPDFLKKRADFRCVQMPLLDVCQSLEATFDVPIVLHHSVTEGGVSKDAPFNFEIDGLTFEELLNHLSRQLQLAWRVDSGIVQITSPEEVRYQTRYHDLHKLTTLGNPLTAVVGMVQLAAENWEEVSGAPGKTALLGESLIVRQTYQNHRRIARILAALERQQSVVVSDACSNSDRLAASLRDPSSLEAVATPLEDVIRSLATEHHVPIIVDARALEEEGINPQITLNLKKRSLGTLLGLMLDEHNLTYQIRDGVIRITTKSEADKDLTLVAYNIGGMVADEDEFAHLTEAIVDTTNGSWERRDGSGGALAQFGSMLLVKQSDRVHSEIQAMLDHLRRSSRGPIVNATASNTKSKMVVKSYRMPKEIATDLRDALRQLVSPESWGIVNDEIPTITLISSSPQLQTVDGLVSGGRDEIRVINQSAPSVPPQKGVASQPPAGPPPAATPSSVTSIVVRPRSTLVIRQTAEVHREIQKFLKNLDVVVESGVPQDANGGFFGGGGGGGMGGGGGFF